MNNSTQARSISRQFWPAKYQLWLARWATCGKITANWIEPKAQKVVMMPSAKPKSPTRLTTKALMAAALAVGFLNQKPIKRYEATPTPSRQSEEQLQAKLSGGGNQAISMAKRRTTG